MMRVLHFIPIGLLPFAGPAGSRVSRRKLSTHAFRVRRDFHRFNTCPATIPEFGSDGRRCRCGGKVTANHANYTKTNPRAQTASAHQQLQVSRPPHGPAWRASDAECTSSFLFWAAGLCSPRGFMNEQSQYAAWVEKSGGDRVPIQ